MTIQILTLVDKSFRK